MVHTKSLREKQHMTQEQLGNILGVSKYTVASYENGHREPPFDILLKLSAYFQVSVDYLIGRTDIPYSWQDAATYLLEGPEETIVRQFRRLNRPHQESLLYLAEQFRAAEKEAARKED